MTFFIPAWIVTLILSSGIFAIAFYFGTKHGEKQTEAVLTQLCEEGYIKHQTNSDGILELLPLVEGEAPE